MNDDSSLLRLLHPNALISMAQRDNTCLWKVLWSVRLIRSDDLPRVQLLIGVRRVDDLFLRVVDNSKSGEAVVGAELSRPSSRNGIAATHMARRIGLRSRASFDLELAEDWRCDMVVDAEGPGTCSRCTYALHLLNCPL